MRKSSYRAVAAWLLTAVRYRAIDVVRRERKHADRRAGEDALYAHPGPGNIAEEAIARENTHRLQDLRRAESQSA
jgi:DNA-directed RNA polymerase specialized sigma24 family protein